MLASLFATVLLVLEPGAAPWHRAVPAPDTLRLEVGSKEVDGRIYQPHAARVQIRIGRADSPVVSEWTNQLSLGDSAGRTVMRWVTKGRRTTPAGAVVTWELRQTYDARSLAPLGYNFRNSNGVSTTLRIDGVQVRGEKRLAADSAPQPVEITLDRPGFFAGASDLVPAAVSLAPGTVMTVPLWSPSSAKTDIHTFAVVGPAPVTVAGTRFETARVEERDASGKLVGTWYLLDHSPYMVYGETPLPDGRTQLITETEIPPEPAP